MRERLGVSMVGFNHRTVSMPELEAANRALKNGSTASVLALGYRGAVAVQTCHRVELYLEGDVDEAHPSVLGAWSEGRMQGPAPLTLEDGAAARHLFRVAAGLEAAVLGDDNILGQLRSAYRAACQGLQAGPLLHRLFHAAFRTGKRVRTRTDLGRGGRSVAGEAVVVINRKLGGLAGRRVLVLGAGEMARTAVERIVKRKPERLLIANRSLDKARELVAVTGGEVVPWSWRSRVLPTVDAVVVGTGAPDPVLSAAELHHAARTRGRMVAVDLSLPRNLEAPEADIPELDLIDLVKLGSLLEAERERRKAAVIFAEEIVEQEVAEWLVWARNRRNGNHRIPASRQVVGGSSA